MNSARERLQKFFDGHPIAAKKSLGQNFLVSDVIIERIWNEVKSFNCQSMIEIGPGPGALTDGLRLMDKPIKVIELDSEFAQHWREQGFEVIEKDALRIDWSDLISRDVLLVSNLPYQISSSLVIDRSLDEQPLMGMVLMFQKEVAQRIRAPARDEHYGMLSVVAQNFWDTKVVTEAGPRDFDPAPKVASRVLVFRPKAGAIRDKKKFFGFVKESFAQRRKLLKANLKSLLNRHHMNDQQLIACLAGFGLKETARAEELSPAQFAELFKALGIGQ